VIAPVALLRAYQAGFFPMGLEDGDIGWFSPDPRGILPLDGFHVPARLARVVRQRRFEIRIDTVFGDVISACADRPDGTWINPIIRRSYLELHRLGHAHSVEAWQERRLVGGLYGVSLRGAFFGESMFSRATNASKVALHGLVERLRSRGYRLLDVQWVTEHLLQFGAIEISRHEYLARLQDAMQDQCTFGNGEAGMEAASEAGKAQVQTPGRRARS
jgi:leucyl/phenylalanyl-tRNA--protein transferase